MDGESPDTRNPRATEFLQALDRLSGATRKLSEVVTAQRKLAEDQIRATLSVFDVVAKKDDGLIAVGDDLIEAVSGMTEEIRGLRQDLRAFAKEFGAVNLSLFGGAMRRR